MKIPTVIGILQYINSDKIIGDYNMGEVFEIFGMRLRIVNDANSGCSTCVLKSFCYPKDYPMPCKDANGNVNRHFERVK